MLLVIDNYDSFTYNIVQYLGEMQVDLQVHRNDQISIEKIRELKPERILISPGPCSPRESGISNEIIRTFGGRAPVLGVINERDADSILDAATRIPHFQFGDDPTGQSPPDSCEFHNWRFAN